MEIPKNGVSLHCASEHFGFDGLTRTFQVVQWSIYKIKYTSTNVLNIRHLDENIQSIGADFLFYFLFQTPEHPRDWRL